MLRTHIILSFFLVGSQFLYSQSKASDLPVIDVSRNYPRKESYLQDIAKVEYIPFETNDKTLMKPRGKIVYVSADYIIASNTEDGDIFVFNGKGKWKYSFNHKGQGPRDYNSLHSIAFDENTKEIFVFDRFSSTHKILVYAENGEFKRALTNFPSLQDVDVYSFDKEMLLVYDKSGVIHQGVTDQNLLSSNPYMFISKKDGSIVDTLHSHLPLRVSNAAAWQEGEYIASRRVPITNNRSFGNNFLIADWSADTIYRLTPYREFQPIFVRRPLVQKTNPKMLLSNFLVTDKFILLGIYSMDYDKIKNAVFPEAKRLIYDFKTGQINENRFKNRDITTSTHVVMLETTTPENIGITMYDVSFLSHLDDKGELRGDLKDLLKTLDLEDNPVLVKITF